MQKFKHLVRQLLIVSFIACVAIIATSPTYATDTLVLQTKKYVYCHEKGAIFVLRNYDGYNGFKKQGDFLVEYSEKGGPCWYSINDLNRVTKVELNKDIKVKFALDPVRPEEAEEISLPAGTLIPSAFIGYSCRNDDDREMGSDGSLYINGYSDYLTQSERQQYKEHLLYGKDGDIRLKDLNITTEPFQVIISTKPLYPGTLFTIGSQGANVKLIQEKLGTVG